jgi:hypothetical protein
VRFWLSLDFFYVGEKPSVTSKRDGQSDPDSKTHAFIEISNAIWPITSGGGNSFIPVG